MKISRPEKSSLTSELQSSSDAMPATLPSTVELEATVRRLETQLGNYLDNEQRTAQRFAEYHNFIDQAIYGVLIEDLEWQIIFANQALAETFWYSSWREFKATGALFVHLPDHEQHRWNEYGRARSSGSPAPSVYEFEAFHLDGHMMTLQNTTRMITWHSQPAVLSSIRDVTEHRQTVNALRKSEAQLRAIIDNSSAGIVLKDSEGRYQLVNRRFEDLYGHGAIDMLGHTVTDVFETELAQQILDRDQQVRKSGNPLYVELNHKDKDGSVRTIAETRFLVPSTDNNVGIGSISTDITKHRQAEQRVQESAQHFRDLIEGSIQGILIHRDWKPLFVNQAFAELHGYDTYQDILALDSYQTLIHPRDQQRLAGYLEARQRGDDAPSNYEFEAIRKDGTAVTLANMVRIVEWQGEFAVQATMVDVSERRLAEHALQLSEARFRDYAQASSDWLWETDVELSFVYLSERFTQSSGRESRATLGSKLWHLAGSRTTTIELKQLRHHLEQHLPLRDAMMWVDHLDGQERHLRLSAKPMADLDGRFIGYRGTGVDVTEFTHAYERQQEAEFRFHEAMETVAVGYALFDHNDRLVICNSTWRYEINAAIADVISPGVSFVELMSALIDRDEIVDAVGNRDQWIAQRMRQHSQVSGSFEAKRSNNQWHQVKEFKTSNGGTVILVSDITDIKLREKELAESEQRFRDFAETAADWFWETDQEHRYTFVSDRFSIACNLPIVQILGTTLAERLAARGIDVESFADHFANLRARRPFADLQISFVEADGSVRAQALSGKPVFDANGDFLGYRGTGQDVTQEHNLTNRLHFQARHDALTGLINRRELEERLQRVLETAHREDSGHALCYLDLDQFKIINDTSGHIAGDQLLRQLSGVLTASVRKRDTLARLGGDEFGLLMEHCSLEQAERVAETLREAVEQFRFVLDRHTFSIGVSIGVVPINAASGDLTEILSNADNACYAAKEEGRNRIHVYKPHDLDLLRRQGEMRWVTRLSHALEDNRFELFYQSIVPAASTTRTGIHLPGCRLELLIRFIDEHGEWVPPDVFLPAAERYNLCLRLDRWVIENAFAWLRATADRLENLSMCSINLSGHSLSDQDCLQFIIHKLRDSDINAHQICFEVTETAAISNLSGAVRMIQTLRELGCKFALDDFGSGLSSFAYLKTLPVDFLKIDGTFVRGIGDDVTDQAMVRSINEIGHVMGKQTIAECVESETALQQLKAIGVDFVQGFLIDTPRPLTQLFDQNIGGIR